VLSGVAPRRTFLIDEVYETLVDLRARLRITAGRWKVPFRWEGLSGVGRMRSRDWLEREPVAREGFSLAMMWRMEATRWRASVVRLRAGIREPFRVVEGEWWLERSAELLRLRENRTRLARISFVRVAIDGLGR